MTIIYLDQLRKWKVFINISSVLSPADIYIVIAKSVSDVPANRSAVLWYAGMAIYTDHKVAFSVNDFLRGKHLLNQSTNQLLTSLLMEEAQ